MFHLQGIGSAPAQLYARVSISVGVVALAAALFGATAAAAAVTMEASVNPPEAMATPQITTGVSSDEPVVITSSIFKMPVGWKAHNPRALRPCTRANFQARNCAENTRIGSVISRAMIGVSEVDATGTAHLLESNAGSEPVKIGYIISARSGDRLIPLPNLEADVTLEPDQVEGSDRIVVTFANPPAIAITNFTITLDGGRKGLIGTGPYNHLLGAQQCGEKEFDGVVTVHGQGDIAVNRTVSINRNCDPSVVVRAIDRGQPSPMRPRFSVRRPWWPGPSSNVTLRVYGAINDGDRGYHTLKDASIYFPVGTRVNLNAVERCGANAGANCPPASKVGHTYMWVAAAGQSHTVRGDVFLTNGGLRMVYTNTPVRLNNRAPIVLNATLQRDGEVDRYHIDVGDPNNVNAAGFPTVYEVRYWSLTLRGRAGGNFLTHRTRGRGRYTAVFNSDYGLLARREVWCSISQC